MRHKKRVRAPRRYVYTIADIAALVGLQPAAVRRLAKPHVRRIAGTETVEPAAFDPSDLASVLAFVSARSEEMKRATAKLLLDAGCDPKKAAKLLGITRSTLYRRARG